MTVRSKVTILSSFLLIILIAGILCACGGPSPDTPPGSDTPSNSNDSDTTTTPADKVEVVYFYWPQRCSGCIYAEDTTLYTLETYFADELASGKITFVALDVAAEENTAIVAKYDAYSSSLFINAIIDGTEHIEEIKEIWFVLDDDEAFVEVVKSKIEQRLSGER
jgi:hypothetical protein